MYTVGRFAAVLLFWICAAGCTLNYIAPSHLDLSQAVLTFDDRFDGDHIDETKWKLASRTVTVNGTLSAWNPAMVSIANGVLKLEVQQVPWLGQSYSGGRIDTFDRSAYLYGFFEARIKSAKGSGLHTSWWLWPENNIWPPEIDIVEIRGNRPTEAMLTLHWPGPGAPSWGYLYETVAPTPDLSADFHVFAIEWAPDHIVWYIDGVERARTTEHIPQTPMRLEIEMSLDDYAGGLNASTVLPAVTLVDYVRVYRMPYGPPVGSPRETAAPGN